MHSLALGTGGNLVKSGFIFGFQGVFGPDGASYLQYQINRAAVIYIFITDLAEALPSRRTYSSC